MNRIREYLADRWPDDVNSYTDSTKIADTVINLLEAYYPVHRAWGGVRG